MALQSKDIRFAELPEKLHFSTLAKHHLIKRYSLKTEHKNFMFLSFPILPYLIHSIPALKAFLFKAAFQDKPSTY